MEEHIVSGPADDWPRFTEPLGAQLVARLRQHGSRVLQVYPDDGHEGSAQWILEAAAAEAARLEAAPGDVVAVCCTFSPHIAPLMLATFCAGAVYAPVNSMQPADELSEVLATLAPKVVYCAAEDMDTVRRAWPHCEPLLLGTAPQTSSELTQVQVDSWEHRPAVYMSTSGTTGRPKQAIFTHGSVSAMLHATQRSDWLIRSDDVMITTSGAFWVSGLTFSLWSINLGVKSIIMRKFEERAFFELVEKFKPTVLFLPCNQCVALAKCSDERKAEKLRCCRLCLAAGTSMSAVTEQQVATSLGVAVQQCYGMTEAFPLVGGWHCPLPQPRGSVGRLGPYQQIKVVDMDTGVPIPAGVDGELWIRGPYVSPGYLHTNTKNSDWFFTGDVGHYDDNGFFYIADRLKQIIKFRGLHIAPSEIEAVLLEHPDVAEAVVLGKPHLTDQEHPTAFVVLTAGASVTAAFLQSLVAGKISNPIKHLRGGVHFVDSLPKSATGKVKRVALREALEQQLHT